MAGLKQRLAECEAALLVERRERMALEEWVAQEHGESIIRGGKFASRVIYSSDIRKLSPRQRSLFGLRPDVGLEAMYDAALSPSNPQ